MVKMIELRPDRNLLDVNFGGYKLSLDPIPSYQHDLETGVDHVQPSDDQYSYLHQKVFTLHNHLIGDPWSPDDVYFIDKTWKVKRNITDVKTGSLKGVKEVWEIPASHPRQAGHYNPSLSFPAAEIALVADGTGTLHIMNSPLRSHWQPQSWKTVFSAEVCGPEVPFVIADSRLHKTEEKSELHCILLRVDEVTAPVKETGTATNFQSTLTWLVLIESEDGKWTVSHTYKLGSQGGLDYVALEADCSALYVACEHTVKFTYDSQRPVDTEEEKTKATSGEGDVAMKEEETENEENKKNYMWQQSAEDIEINFSLPPSVQKNEIVVNVKETSLHIECCGVTLLAGDTWGCTDPNLTCWTIENGRLQVTVSKAESGLMWQALVPSDGNGEEVLDAALVEDVHQRLAHLCSDQEVVDTTHTPAFNSEQLEECDTGGTNSVLLRLDPSTHTATHQASLGGHQILFTARLAADTVTALCLRHDVDGCVWQPSQPADASDTWPVTHTGTFHAFGYVQASKTQKKFSLCSPDLSYVLVCDASRHVYVYRQPEAVQGELRNRRTGQRVAQTAHQQLFALRDASEVLGAHASAGTLFILTASYLLALRVNP